ncbi:aromatic-ring-hydroxylating dioxygenase subunit beta [Sphingobium sp.]|uniref:aromatic-ring-hydroxylating dioxygenase subunit beta n=1 Tax=Sphingobium sp. TaxID=1912891 RepID=UPI0028BF1D44|nr:aromatic-ring-hydroxylating dioxygenase subunit beta [Sphingobium sp.]
MATVTEEARSTWHDHVSDAEYRMVMEFLFREAMLLDAGRLVEWLELLAPQIRYTLETPRFEMVQATMRQGEPSVCLMNEDMGSLEARVKQLTTPSLTLAENPRSISRRFVTNILVERHEGQLLAHSNVLLHRLRVGQGAPHGFSTQRTDRFAMIDGRLKLAQRQARLDEPMINTHSISAMF